MKYHICRYCPVKAFILLMCLTLLSACGVSKKQTPVIEGGVQWTSSNSLTEAIEEAELENKLVFIDFYTSWCTPCKMMDRDVFADKDIYSFLNDNFINYKVNAERDNGPNLALMYGVQSYPTLIFVDYKGRVLSRKNGAAYHTELKKLANVAIALGRGL